MIKIRKFQTGDEFTLWQLKVHTIKKINTRDYSAEQIKAWAPDTYNSENWTARAQNMQPFIAEVEGEVVGFSDLQDDGYIDHFFCHCDFQGQGVGKALMLQLIANSKHRKIPHIYSHVSITAKPFFEAFGFKAVQQQTMDIGDQSLPNYVMHKTVAFTKL